MTILVSGGAGYIGSHCVRQLLQNRYQVIVLDNLSTGWSWAVSAGAKLMVGDINDTALVTSLIQEYSVSSAIHFAGLVEVDDSMSHPIRFYENNFIGSVRFISACLDAGVSNFIYSSSASVYGIPTALPLTESAPLDPVSPYGNTKLMTEKFLQDVVKVPKHKENFRFVSLRYFNVAGASEDATLGQASKKATHLIKLGSQAALGIRPELLIFGTDYPTKDGTCIRDYIHVEDLADAHVQSLRYLEQGGGSEILNCGYGYGFSVREVISTLKRVTGIDFPVREVGKRPGDPAESYADTTKIKRVLGWKPRFSNLEGICLSAFRFEDALQKRNSASS